MDTQKISTADLYLIDPDRIDDSPGPYCMSFGFEIEPLMRSIKRVGLVNSPVLTEGSKGTMTVISGYRRIQAVKSLKWDNIPCRVLQESEFSPLECLLLNLHENLATRSLNNVEKGMVLSHLNPFLPLTEIMKDYMPLLDLPSHEETFDFFLKIEKELNENIKVYLAQGHISLQVVRMLLDMDPVSVSPIFALISSLKFNINQQIQLINYIVDISHITKVPGIELLKEQDLENICLNNNLNTPQKAKAVLRLLRTMRFPLLTEAEKTFNKMVSSLNLPKRVRIDPPLFFESPDYRLEILFKEGKELREKIERLFQMKGIEALGNPWERGA
ncbi:MAG: ParB N-terminal domain-containing protein [Deltaproteobacteria bacterium]|nr:ParB N-terminal domain-containing protein [Deltaproteobacteria bacterium]